MYWEHDITVPSKRVPWGGATGDGDFIIEGQNLSGGTYVFAIASAEGVSPSKSVTGAAAGSEGVSASYDANYVNEQGAQVGATTLRVQIDETSMETLGAGSFVYDLLVTPSGAPQRLICKGAFVVQAGVGD